MDEQNEKDEKSGSVWDEFLWTIQKQPNETVSTYCMLWVTRLGLVAMFLLMLFVWLSGIWR